MISVLLKSLALMVSLTFLGLAFNLGSIDSAIIDFTKLSAQELQMFRWVCFIGFTAFLSTVPFVGDEI